MKTPRVLRVPRILTTPWVFSTFVGALLFIVATSCRGPEDRRVGPERDRGVNAEIEIAERSRYFTEAEFRSFLAHQNPHVRSRAARALGRIADPRGVKLLVERVEDPAETKGVLSEVAFALGQLAAPEAVGPLLELKDHASARVRARAIAALGRIPLEPSGVDRRTVSDAILRALRDGNPRVRAAAALAAWRGAHLSCIPHLASLLSAEEEENVRWRAAYALCRLEDPATIAPLTRVIQDPNPWVQTFAARGLRSPLYPGDGSELLEVLMSPQSFWTARVEAARTLEARFREAGDDGDGATFDRSGELQELLGREKHPLVVEAIISALAARGGPQVFARLQDFTNPSKGRTIRRNAIEALSRVDPGAALEKVREFVDDDDPLLRVAAVRALADCGLPGEPPARSRCDDPDPRVRAAAVETLSRIGSESGWATILERSNDPDVAVRGSVVAALTEKKPRGWKTELVRIFEASSNPSHWEARTTILDALRDDTEIVTPLAEHALNDLHAPVRRTARRILQRLFTRRPPLPDLPAPRIRPEELFDRGNPWLTLETEKGEIAIELYLEDAPLHVSSIVHLARAGFYDGLDFHRVVPNWVIQGGDPSATGWGDAGVLLPDERNPRPYLRGTVGMPKAGDDTGGCQLFITHLPTPRLDGRYTVFGRVGLGMEVVDRIEVGDRILRARVDEHRFRPSKQILREGEEGEG